MSEHDDDVLYPNGVDPDGGLAWQPVRFDELPVADVGRAEWQEPETPQEDVFRRLRPGLSEDDLTDAGWVVVHPPGYDEVLDELTPLLELRAQQAGAAYRPPIQLDPSEEIDSFYRRLRVSWGAADPSRLPYYVLLLGGPDEISFGKQQVIGEDRAVGRLCLERPRDYATYAHNVRRAEERPRRERPEATFFAAVNGQDNATRRTREQLVRPLADHLEETQPLWRVRRVEDDAATKPRLLSLLTDEAPPLLFTASHGLAARFDDPRQREKQGALISSEWPGTDDSPLAPASYLTGAELPAELGLDGAVAFLFACYGAGTPQQDTFWFKATEPGPRRTAEPPFVSRLVQALLSRPGGAAAAIGHVDRAWTSSFFWHRAGQVDAFVDTLAELIRGARVGDALSWLHDLGRSSRVNVEVYEEHKAAGLRYSASLLDRHRLASADARNFVVCGDPAVRLPIV